MIHNLKIVKVLPLIIFVMIILVSGLVLYQVKYFSKNTKILKSQLIGKNIPSVLIKEFHPNLKGQKNINLDFSDFEDQIFAVNFFASWCAPCKVEAPMIEELSKIIPVVGIAYKDQIKNTNMFLKDYGNPYNKIGLDDKGKVAIEWGVYGVPETFIINNSGKIIFRHAGPLLYDVYENEILTLLKNNKIND